MQSETANRQQLIHTILLILHARVYRTVVAHNHRIFFVVSSYRFLNVQKAESLSLVGKNTLRKWFQRAFAQAPGSLFWGYEYRRSGSFFLPNLKCCCLLFSLSIPFYLKFVQKCVVLPLQTPQPVKLQGTHVAMSHTFCGTARSHFSLNGKINETRVLMRLCSFSIVAMLYNSSDVTTEKVLSAYKVL